MANHLMVALSNPMSADQEDEFNRWYNEIHGPEVASIEGFRNMTRYRAVAQAVPPSDTPKYRYLCIYELDDIDQALTALAVAASNFEIPPAVDLSTALGIAFTEVFTTKAA